MARAISYFIFSSNGSYLRWDDDTTIDFRIRQRALQKPAETTPP